MQWQKQHRGALSRKKKSRLMWMPLGLRWRDWRRKAGEIKDRDVPRRSRVVAQGATINVAKKMAQYPTPSTSPTRWTSVVASTPSRRT
jgi:hypothetical protein